MSVLQNAAGRSVLARACADELTKTAGKIDIDRGGLKELKY